jgi:hypothetical protein
LRTRTFPRRRFKGGIRKPSRANASHDSPSGALSARRKWSFPVTLTAWRLRAEYLGRRKHEHQSPLRRTLRGNPFYLRAVHVGVCATRGDPSRSVERLCLARRVRHAAQLANVSAIDLGALLGGSNVDSAQEARATASSGCSPQQLTTRPVGSYLRCTAPQGRYPRWP